MHRSPFWPKFSTLVGAEVVGVRCGRASVRLREYCEPLFSLEGLEVCPDRPGLLAMSEEVDALLPAQTPL